MSSKVILIGFGTVNQLVCDILISRPDLKLQVVGVCDSTGFVSCASRFELDRLLEFKRGNNQLQDYTGASDLDTVLNMENYDILVEASSSSGLYVSENALEKGKYVVLANKGPIVDGLELSTRVQYSATVCGGLPIVNLLRGLGVAKVHRLTGILNLTANFVLDHMPSMGFEGALQEAQRLGHAEADPSGDIDGWDAARKLVILMKTLGVSVAIADVDVTGIRGITSDMIAEASLIGCKYKLVASAVVVNDEYSLKVSPDPVPLTDFLCTGPTEMGVVLETDINGVISLKIDEEDPLPTAAAVVRDIVYCSTRLK